jgi:hypothetical protein
MRRQEWRRGTQECFHPGAPGKDWDEKQRDSAHAVGQAGGLAGGLPHRCFRGCVRHATLERYFLTDTYCPSRLPAEKRLTTFLNLTDSKRIDK